MFGFHTLDLVINGPAAVPRALDGPEARVLWGSGTATHTAARDVLFLFDVEIVRVGSRRTQRSRALDRLILRVGCRRRIDDLGSRTTKRSG